MIVRVDPDRARVELVEVDLVRELTLVAPAGATAESIAATIGRGSAAEDEHHVRLAASTIIRLARMPSAEWVAAFRATLRSVEPMGWYDAEADFVRLHIEPDASAR